MRFPVPFVFASLLTLSGCAGVQPIVPRIERLPEGAAGPISTVAAHPLSLKDVAQMARDGTPSKVIIQSLRDSRAAYAISSVEAGELSGQGVPYEVVDFLRWGERTAVEHPYTYPYPVYAPYFFAPGIRYSRRGISPYSRYPISGIGLRFGFRR